jgi:hypothetical protein
MRTAHVLTESSHAHVAYAVAAAAAAAAATQNAEIFTLTYGSIVRQLIADFEDLDEVNKQLEKM